MAAQGAQLSMQHMSGASGGGLRLSKATCWGATDGPGGNRIRQRGRGARKRLQRSTRKRHYDVVVALKIRISRFIMHRNVNNPGRVGNRWRVGFAPPTMLVLHRCTPSRSDGGRERSRMPP
jgi:hypothetical protein